MSIIKSLPVVAKALGEQMGVKVIVWGEIAKTNGEVIFLPQLPEDDEEATLLARGFLDHEAGHVRLTDFEVSEDDPYHANLANIIEDIRIEQGMGQLYPGCAVNLRNLANHMAAKGKFDFDPGDPAHLFLGWCLSRCRSRVLRQDGLIPVFEKANQILTPLLGSELLGKVARLLDTVGNLDSTEEASLLAKRIIDLLKQEEQQAPQQSPQPDDSSEPDNSTPPSDGGDSGEQSDGSGQQGQGQDQNQESSKSDMDKGGSSDTDQAGNNQDSSSSQPDSGQDGDEADNGQDGEGGQKQNQGEDSQGQPQDKEGSPSDTDSGDSPGGDNPQQRRQTIEQILAPGDSTESYGDLGEMVAGELEGKATDARMSGAPDQMSMEYPGESLAEHNILGPAPDLFEVRKKTSALRARLGSLIQASKLKRSCAGRSGRNIDHRVLSRLPVGDTRVFRRKEDKTAINTAVLILLDRSGSMDGHKMVVASQATLAMADALRTVPGVNVATAAFPGSGHRVVPLTPFGAMPARTIQNYGITAEGGTPLAPALGWAAVQFAARQETRKILVVVTDGQPTEPVVVHDYLRRLAAEGIEQMAIGIGDRGLCGIFFRNHRSINDVDELPKALFEMLQQTLT